MSEDEYITLNQTKESGHNQKIATITDKGRKRFFELMGQRVPLNPNIEFIYSVKFRNFHQVNQKMQLEILREYKSYLLDNQKLLNQQGLELAETKISPSDLKNARWVMSLEQEKDKAALKWVDQALRKY